MYLPAAALLALIVSTPAHAYTITITAGTRAIYLQVGDGTYTGGNYNQGGTPGSNPTINSVTVTVPAASVGNGAVQAMTSDSTASNSFIDGFAFCNLPAQVYIGDWARSSGTANATLTITTPAKLTNGTATIPFSQIIWTTSGNATRPS